MTKKQIEELGFYMPDKFTIRHEKYIDFWIKYQSVGAVRAITAKGLIETFANNVHRQGIKDGEESKIQEIKNVLDIKEYNYSLSTNPL